MLKDHNAVTPVRLEPAALRSRVKHSTTEPLGHQVNSDIHLQTVEIQMRRLLMSRLIRIFAVCLVYFFVLKLLKYETKVAVRVYQMFKVT